MTTSPPPSLIPVISSTTTSGSSLTGTSIAQAQPSATEVQVQQTVRLMQSVLQDTVQQLIPPLQQNIANSVNASISATLRQQQQQIQALQLTVQQQQTAQVAASRPPSAGSQGESAHTSVSITNTGVGGTNAQASLSAATLGRLPIPSLVGSVSLLSTRDGIVSSIGQPGTGNSSSNTAVSWSVSTPLQALLPTSMSEVAQQSSTEAVVIGTCTPPIPKKLAQKIWKGEYVDLYELSPMKLGTPEPTILDIFQSKQKKARGKSEKIDTIEMWVRCFNAFVAVMAKQHPGRVIDLLAYSSLIVKASQDFEQNTPWLSYDQHFRKHAAAAKGMVEWGSIEPSLWSLYFGRATAKPLCIDCGEVGHATCTDDQSEKAFTSYGSGATRQGRYDRRFKPYSQTPPKPVCFRWNSPNGCTWVNCSYRHICRTCHAKDHKDTDCPSKKQTYKSDKRPFRSQEGKFPSASK